jgi:hypothetical protein
MNILEMFSRKDSGPRQPAQCGEAIIVRKQADAPTSIIGVAVRLENGPGARLMRLERPAIIELSDESVQYCKRARVFRSRWNLMRVYFMCGAIHSVRYAGQHLDDVTRRRLEDARIIYTRFVGLQMGWEWDIAVTTALQLAYFHALGDPPLTRKFEMGEWKEI